MSGKAAELENVEEILADPSGQTSQLLPLKSDLGLQLCFQALLWKFMCQNCPI